MKHKWSLTNDTSLKTHLRHFLNKSFYHKPPTLDAYRQQLIDKQSFDSSQRHLLYTELKEQYAHINTSPEEQSSLENLQSANTFTITTGHQICLGTGPAYFIYKILNTIKLAQDLKAAYPNYNFVPIYWAATEDHDFAEIQHLTFANKTYHWHPIAPSENTPVGKIQTDQALSELISEMTHDQNPFRTELSQFLDLLAHAYQPGTSLSQSMRKIVHKLFSSFGVLMIDADSSSLKNTFKDIIAQDVLHQQSFKTLTQTEQEWTADGYRFQIPPKPCNFFIIQHDQRLRINYIEALDTYEVDGTEIDKTTMNRWIEEQPEIFSPNVFLRPLYQEHILPNIAYVGGAAEIGYWLPLKSLFEMYDTPFPQLHLRSTILKLDGAARRLLSHFDLHSLIHKPTAELIKIWTVKQQQTIELSTIEHQQKMLDAQLKTLFEASSIPNLRESFAGHYTRISHQLDALKKKVLKHYANQNTQGLSQLDHFKKQAYVGSTFQERKANYFSLFTVKDYRCIIDHIDPFDPSILIH